jgi:hypothetical protein
MTTSSTGGQNEENGVSWELAIGLYPGFLFGIRTYEEPTYNTHVLYLPFINILLTIDK